MIVNMTGMGGGSASKMPAFEYTGSYQLLDDGKEGSTQNWRIKLFTSAVFTPARDMLVDVFLVGGGGGTCGNSSGAGGGYTKTNTVMLKKGTAYPITIGAGGAAEAAYSGRRGGTGGDTTAFGATAKGGLGGASSGTNYENGGGDGGSGGGAYSPNPGGSGGVDGADGATLGNFAPGIGQHTTTREFGEANGTLYSTGGDARYASPNRGTYDEANTGNGACAVSSNGNKGGSGIVVIRNHRG